VESKIARVYMVEDDITKWMFSLRIDNEEFIGEVVFPANFPANLPVFTYISENSRFKVGEPICLGEGIQETDIVVLFSLLIIKTFDAPKL
jgi:hypothetical protein